MTERTYGAGKWTLEQMETIGSELEKEMAAHIRELQADYKNAAECLYAAEQEIVKLKAERRELAFYVARAVWVETDEFFNAQFKGNNYPLAAIVEQELKK